ncbi:MAG TPA: methyltransferase domain-containing protein [Thermoanaerobaculaceae bacterium]|nr:methyltransferase domain-containing protein [Thermoanaerobaculaceae bacterium]
MPLFEGLVEMLQCPHARVPLAVMGDRELGELNSEIARGGARHGSGDAVTLPVEGALAAIDGTAAYAIRDGVPDLLPERRIVRGVRPPQPIRPDPRSDAFEVWDARWDHLSQNWHLIGPPLRPFPEDVDLLRRLVDEAAVGAPRGGARALLLGVTPEIAAMRWPAGTALLALDSSKGMIRNLWPRHGARDAAAARGDWTAMPVRDGACDVLVGDGIFTTLQYPDHFLALAGEMRRVLRDTGTLVMRLFARPEEREPLEAIFSDLRDGRTVNEHILPWRIAMAVHGDLSERARLGDIWDAWREHVPDAGAVLDRLGRPPDAMDFLEVYRDVDARVSLPTLGEVRDLLGRDFVERACHVPRYEAGDQYPTVVFTPRRRAGS